MEAAGPIVVLVLLFVIIYVFRKSIRHQAEILEGAMTAIEIEAKKDQLDRIASVEFDEEVVAKAKTNITQARSINW